MRLQELYIKSPFKNLDNLKIDFSLKEGLSVLIGNNGTGKSNILEAVSSIFAGLFDKSQSPIFSYSIKYSVNGNNVEIEFDRNSSKYQTIVNGISDNIKDEYLPSQVVSCYSGEESRLWNGYYEHFYKKYIDAIITSKSIPSQPLLFINKYYWNIALLTFHFYDFDSFTDLRDFCQNELSISKVNYIKFKFDTAKTTSWGKNIAVEFVKAINPNSAKEIEITLSELKSRLSHITNGKDFFNYLSLVAMSKEDKLITDIEFNFNNNLTTSSLSEGEKKLILIKLILEVVADESSLILLDEPDSHIHISRKANLQHLLTQYSNRENILTTHSPTLTHCFENKHIIMLSKSEVDITEVIDSEKQQIIDTLTNGIWSYQDQNIFLNSHNDILLVEGKTDEIFIKKALSVLKKSNPEYAILDFEYLPCGGAEGVKLLADKFKPKSNQKIIALFDRDSAGWRAINDIFGETQNKWNSNSFGLYRKCKQLTIMPYPARSNFKGSNFNIEDYFSKTLLKHYVLKDFEGLDSLISKNTFKKAIETNCHDFEDKDFKYFKKLFDLILEVKDTNS